ncbi:acetyl-CoA carboxylase biotin carboxyl carrier protein [Helicobacter sp. MIT 05-5293]|uniref:acetyl-CoA carboxylase biotin carboxyl carrier protein n=1 Tax=Helicobacter sp. MIT 05-5293 TaxID=1548149 RepID=UPI00051DE651|nr:acetyl-CoA carboxylase biotin carboxyl carrier protein [Helicobacter sp. MIT 05-5293]TLD80394.1 acetyl-CoA carboxylase biotin carboxyl carrier protein [Helicobacter sp. MIT 05-5293]
MNLQEIKKIMELFDNSDIAKFSIKQENFELKLQKAGANTQITTIPATQMQNAPVASIPASAPSPTPDITPANTPSKGAEGHFITSPMVGTFYRSPSPGAAPYINVGDKVKKGQTVGIIEAMKIMNEIEAEFDCKIVAIEVNDGQPVEFSTNLIKVEKL